MKIVFVEPCRNDLVGGMEHPEESAPGKGKSKPDSSNVGAHWERDGNKRGLV